MIAWKTEGTKLYQKLPSECYETLKECEPLREAEHDRTCGICCLQNLERIQELDDFIHG